MSPLLKNVLTASCVVLCTALSAQNIGESPRIFFNLLPVHADTDQDLQVGARDPDGSISEIRLRLHERPAGASSYSVVWTEFGNTEQLTVSGSPLAGLSSGSEYAISVRVVDNDGNQSRIWEEIAFKEADVPVLATDLSQFIAPIPEGDTRSLTFTHEDSDADADLTEVFLNGRSIRFEGSNSSAGSVTLQNPLVGLQPGRHLLAIRYRDLGHGNQYCAIRFEIADNPAVESAVFPLTVKTETVRLDEGFTPSRIHEEAFLWASNTVPESGKWPLIIMLHGGGGFNNGIAGLNVDSAPLGHHNSSGHSVMRLVPGTSGSWQISDLNAMLDHLIETYPIDPEQIHLMGHSMGAQRSIDWCVQDADRFATLATHSPYFLTATDKNTSVEEGAVLESVYLTAAQNPDFYSLPYRAYHAGDDGWQAGSQLMVEELNKLGPAVAEHIVLEGLDHNGGKNSFMYSRDLSDFQLSYTTSGKIPQLVSNLPDEVSYESDEPLEVTIEAAGQVIVSHAIYLDEVLKYSGTDAAVSLSNFYAGLEAKTRHAVRIEVAFASGAELNETRSFLVGPAQRIVEQWTFSGPAPETGVNGLTIDSWTAVAPNSVVTEGVLRYETYADSITVTFASPIDTTAIDQLKLTVAVDDLQFNAGEMIKFIFVASGADPEIEFTAWNATSHTFAPDMEYNGSSDDLDATVTNLNGAPLGGPLVMTAIWDFDRNMMSFETTGAVETYVEESPVANMAEVIGTITGFRLDGTDTDNAVAFMELDAVTIEVGGDGPGETFGQWQAHYVWEALSDQAAAADPNGNGISNLLEYAMGNDPVVDSPGNSPS
jgi:pimeloyl-ACP methyl ester carboxylesterase